MNRVKRARQSVLKFTIVTITLAGVALVLGGLFLRNARQAAEEKAKQVGFSVVYEIGVDQSIPFLTDELLNPQNRSTPRNLQVFGDPVGLSGPTPPDPTCRLITDADLSILDVFPGIHALSLRQCSISDAGLLTLRRHTQLTHLSLSGTDITDAGLRCLHPLERLIELDLSHTKISNEGLVALCEMTSLERLSLRNTQVTDEGLRNLPALTELKNLNLDSCRITGRGISHLASLPSLDWLSLMYASITDEDIEVLARLQTLTYLGVQRTGITEQGADRLRQFIPGVTVTVAPYRFMDDEALSWEDLAN